MGHALGCLLAAAVMVAVAAAAVAQTIIASQRFSDWQLDTYQIKAGRARGVRNSDPGPRQTHVIQQYAWNADKKTVSLVTRIRFFQPRQATLMFILPPETDKSSKVNYAVNSAADATLPIVDCNERFCFASTKLNDRLLRVLRKGTTLSVGYHARGQRLSVPVSLIGFTRAYEALGRFASR